MIEGILRKSVKESLQKLGLEADEVNFEHPADFSHGDYSTNIALVLAKTKTAKNGSSGASKEALRKENHNPKELANKIVENLEKSKEVEKIEVAGAGFINFHLTKEFFASSLKEATREDFGKNESLKGKKVLVEHSSPNLFKPFHIGHIMNNTIGESAVRLAEYTGADVIRMSYPSDLSLSIAKAVWALLEKGVDKLDELKTIKEKLKFLGECYAEGVRAFDENPKAKSRVEEIIEILYQKKEGVELDAYNLGKEINLTYFKGITERLGTTIDSYIYESEAGPVGEEIVRDNIGKVFEESEGAIIYRGEQDGFHTRVFINKNGKPVYEAKDIGLLDLKFKKFSPDYLVYVTDNEQSSYFEVVMSAAAKINPVWKERMTHFSHGRMSFMGSRMSSRLGGIPLAQDVLDTTAQEVLDRSGSDITSDDADKIAIAAIKFAILRSAPGKDINFDPDTSLSFEGDSGPYLQYTYVRAKSALKIAEQKGIRPSDIMPSGWEITELEKILYRFPEVALRAWEEKGPQLVAKFLIDLAGSFNSFYAQEKIALEGGEYKVLLTKAAMNTLKNGLYLLGIKVPDKM